MSTAAQRSWARERLETEQREDRKAAVDLARFLSAAVFIEPELLRAMRVEVLPTLDVDAEADLWFGRLVRSRSVQGIRLLEPVLDELRSQLAKRWRKASKSESESDCMMGSRGETPVRTLVHRHPSRAR